MIGDSIFTLYRRRLNHWIADLFFKSYHCTRHWLGTRIPPLIFKRWFENSLHEHRPPSNPMLNWDTRCKRDAEAATKAKRRGATLATRKHNFNKMFSGDNKAELKRNILYNNRRCWCEDQGAWNYDCECLIPAFLLIWWKRLRNPLTHYGAWLVPSKCMIFF